jgi:phenylacetic acid degradation operon negative regulatory protein
MAATRSRPSDIVLDLLRGARSRGQSARSLVAAGALFGLTDNTVRVTLSRLMARGLIESPARGTYRLTQRTDALNAFVERWRLGEARVRPWRSGEWLFAHVQGELAGNLWALDALGFREVRGGLYARPDNLALQIDALRALGAGIGLAPGVLLIAGRPDGEPMPAAWLRAWHPAALDDGYVDMLQRLRDSAAKLERLPADEARLQSFRLGGEAIHLLAKDPLLPADVVDAEARAELWREMTQYEALGKSIWAGAFDSTIRAMPIPQLATTH